jgi:hypothetical protein
MIHRPFNKSIVDGDDFIKISKTERLADEIYYYHYMQQFEIKNLFAEFRGDVSNGANYALKLKNYNCNNFYENSKNIDFDKENVFNLILQKLKELHNFKLEQSSDNEIASNQKILIDKTEIEFKNFINKSNTYMDHVTNCDTIIINGQNCENFPVIWPQIKKLITKNYIDFELSLIHGDFCLANILSNPINSELIFIDPRGSYHLRGCFGDKAYDYAKLLHSVHGNYEQIIYDDYDFRIFNRNIIEFDFFYDFSNLLTILEKSIDPLLFEKSKLIEGLLFISMCSRHYDNEQHQFIMYCQGLSILNQIIKNQSNFSNY